MGLFARVKQWLQRVLHPAATKPADTEQELMRFFGGNGEGLGGSVR
jgi:hypothetical protein